MSEKELTCNLREEEEAEKLCFLIVGSIPNEAGPASFRATPALNRPADQTLTAASRCPPTMPLQRLHTDEMPTAPSQSEERAGALKRWGGLYDERAGNARAMRGTVSAGGVRYGIFKREEKQQALYSES